MLIVTSLSVDWVRISWVCLRWLWPPYRFKQTLISRNNQVLVFQFPVVETICVIIQEVTQVTGHYCTNSLDPWFAHLYVMILNSIAIGACVTSILKFRGHMKKRMKARRGLAKLVCFKIIVALRFFQAWIFSMLLQYKVIKPGKTFSYNGAQLDFESWIYRVLTSCIDILWGIPGLATCIEMTFCALLFWYAYSSTEYNSKARPNDTPMPVYKAFFHALSPFDIFIGIYRIPSICKQLHQNGDWSRWKEVRKQKGAQGFIRKKFGGSKGDGQGQGRYERMDDDRESQSIDLPPYDPYKARSTEQDFGYQAPMNFGGNSVYHPPSRSPPEEATGFLSPNERHVGA